MPCYQSTNLPGGVTTTGRTGYATEAECNQACQEGACCEGTTCTVKPQCQCQCTSGSCCGPDTVTVDGVTGPRCRGGTKSECDQRGGLWACGFACSTDEKTGIGICSSAMMANPNAPVFKGVGTTCTPNPCLRCGGCTASHPTYLTVAFTQTAPITVGYHESLIDLSGSYSIPSLATGESNCAFSGHFTKTYSGAIPSGSLFVNFNVDAWFYGFFDSPAIALQIYGVMYNSLDPRDRGPGLYQFTVTTGTPSGVVPNYLGGNLTQIGYGGGELQRFSSCIGNAYAAVRLGYTLVESPYKYITNSTSVECGVFSWS